MHRFIELASESNIGGREISASSGIKTFHGMDVGFSGITFFLLPDLDEILKYIG